MAHRQVNHAPIMNVLTGRRATLWRCTETGEWVVKFYRESASSIAEGLSAPRWQYLGEQSDYFTSDKDDAYGTANHFIQSKE
ncbi:hypothetical protein Stalingrad_4 [Pseudomonas phage Stalingrad]|uniref:Uncharacterized protein n=1 Tax=Pseudomonas phage Stalingrad TaxID=2762287 RepID=A0A7G8LJ81_9CAUD|nr:hypothetical protein Stalingrad_4 [Pseudomonas phage Stalingrad]